MSRLFKILALTGLLALAAGCNSSTGTKPSEALDVSNESQAPSGTELAQDPRAYCPKTVLRAGTETYRIFPKGVKRDDPGALAKLRFQATITQVSRECNYQPNRLNMRVGVAGRVINGPTGETGTIEMPVRIAVTRGDEVLYSRLHQIPATIPEGGGNTTFRFVDNFVDVPIPDKPNLLVYVGYDEGPYDAQ